MAPGGPGGHTASMPWLHYSMSGAALSLFTQGPQAMQNPTHHHPQGAQIGHTGIASHAGPHLVNNAIHFPNQAPHHFQPPTSSSSSTTVPVTTSSSQQFSRDAFPEIREPPPKSKRGRKPKYIQYRTPITVVAPPGGNPSQFGNKNGSSSQPNSSNSSNQQGQSSKDGPDQKATNNEPNVIVKEVYKCCWPRCGKKFTQSSNLAKHQLTHTGITSCPDSFRDSC